MNRLAFALLLISVEVSGMQPCKEPVMTVEQYLGDHRETLLSASDWRTKEHELERGIARGDPQFLKIAKRAIQRRIAEVISELAELEDKP